VGTKKPQLGLEVSPGSLCGFAAGNAGMVLYPVKQLGVECLEQFGTFFPGGGTQTGREFFFDLVVMAEALRGAGVV